MALELILNNDNLVHLSPEFINGLKYFYLGHAWDNPIILPSVDRVVNTCRVCLNSPIVTSGMCPLLQLNAEGYFQIYISTAYTDPYLDFFKRVDVMHQILVRLNFQWEATFSYPTDLSIYNLNTFIPRNLQEFLAPVKNMQLQFHPDSDLYNKYGMLIERMIKLHSNVWINSPFSGSGLAMRASGNDLNTIANSPVLREAFYQDTKIFHSTILYIIKEIKTFEEVFPRV